MASFYALAADLLQAASFLVILFLAQHVWAIEKKMSPTAEPPAKPAAQPKITFPKMLLISFVCCAGFMTSILTIQLQRHEEEVLALKNKLASANQAISAQAISEFP